MKVCVIGSGGGVALSEKTTSYLIDKKILIDAGSVASGLTISEQNKIDHIFLSHAHLDHIKDLAFLCDNCFGMRSKPFQVYCNQYVYNAIHKHIFNDVIWPNFSKLPSPSNPIVKFHVLNPGEKKVLEMGIQVTPIQVHHPGNAFGFLVQEVGGTPTVVFTLDTGPTERIWIEAKKCDEIKAIFTEVSFPNELESLARESCHHTPFTLGKELVKMPEQCKIFLGHLKPPYREKLIEEIAQIGNERIEILDSSSKIYHF